MSARDDSKDPFYTDTIPLLCGPNGVPGACDAILDQICYPYTYEEVLNSGDETLLTLCGCHLSRGQDPTTVAQNGGINMTMPSKMENQYTLKTDPNTAPVFYCDPLCLNPTALQHCVGEDNPNCSPCQMPICEISGVQVDIINSKIENGEAVEINQFCGCSGNGQGGTTCTGGCYLGGLDIKEVDSWAKAGLKLGQHCGNCFLMKQPGNWDPSNITPVDCNTLKPKGHCATTPCECPDYFNCDKGTGDCLPKYTCNPVCPADFVCNENKKCVPKCTLDCGKCDAGYTCDTTTGQCKAKPGGCGNDSDCPSGYKCENGKCKKVTPSGGKSTWDKYKWYIIGGGIGLLVLIISLLLLHHHLKRKRR